MNEIIGYLIYDKENEKQTIRKSICRYITDDLEVTRQRIINIFVRKYRMNVEVQFQYRDKLK